MAIVNKPNTFTSNTAALASEVNDNFDTIYNEFNGSISSANLADSAVSTAKIADGAITSAKLASGLVDSGWLALSGTHSVATGYNAGNRSFTIDTSADHSGIVSAGMRYKVTRATTPPTQCADLESGSSHYASKTSPTGISFTDDFTCEAWVKPESYATTGFIIAKNSVAGTNGFRLYLNTSGQVTADAFISAGNSKTYNSYQSVPTGKWVHVAATVDMSGNVGTIYIDGVSVPVQTTATGTANSLTQAGNLYIGTQVGTTSYFDGKLADVRIWSDIRTATEIQDNMFAYPSDTTGLVAHFKLNGGFTDASSNGNDLTAQNSAVATDTDNPWNATEYGVITKVTSSQLTVFCPSGYGIPNETISTPYYSTQGTPYGFPRDKGKWVVESFYRSAVSQSSPSNGTYYNLASAKLDVPLGAWNLGYETVYYAIKGTAGTMDGRSSLSTSSSSVTDLDYSTRVYAEATTAATTGLGTVKREKYQTLSASTSYYLIYASILNSATTLTMDGTAGTTKIFADCAYI